MNSTFSGEFAAGYRTGLIEIGSGEPNSGSNKFASNVEGINCDPAGTIVPVTAVEASIEHTLRIAVYGYSSEATGVSVVPFANGPDANLAALTAGINLLNSAPDREATTMPPLAPSSPNETRSASDWHAVPGWFYWPQQRSMGNPEISRNRCRKTHVPLPMFRPSPG